MSWFVYLVDRKNNKDRADTKTTKGFGKSFDKGCQRANESLNKDSKQGF